MTRLDLAQIYIFLLHFLLTSYPQEPWRYFQIASCISLSTPGYMHETIHIFHQLFFITLSVIICDFGCFITLFVISMYCTCTFSFYYCSFSYWNLAVFITCYWNIKLTYFLATMLPHRLIANKACRLCGVELWVMYFGKLLYITILITILLRVVVV